MALVEIDSWSTEYEACNRLSQTIRRQLLQREKRQSLSPEFSQLTNSVQVGLNQFANELKQLKSKLDISVKTNSIDVTHVAERQRNVDELETQLVELRSKFNNTVTPSELERTLLLEPSSSSGSQRETSKNSATIIDTNDVDLLKKQQIDILESQNQGLEALSQSISRQRALASQLGQEVEGQNDILDNLANTMERVDARVNVETGNISHITRQDSTWGYWVVIILLFIANFILGFIL